MNIIAEGKTKKIVSHDSNPYLVYIVSKDDITAGDGAKHDVIEGKAILSTRTSANIMQFLNQQGFLTHFIRQADEVTQLVRGCRMIPIECVARRVAFGSYLKRNPGVAEGTIFEEPVIEFFYKDDELHDPIIVDRVGPAINLHDPRKPIMEETIVGLLDLRPMLEKIGWGQHPFGWSDWNALAKQLKDRTREIFLALEIKWREQNVILVDIKIEFGLDSRTGAVLLADVIDNDSWRCWPDGDKSQMLDKQVYRDLKIHTPQALESFKGKLKEVADRTDLFII